MTTRGARAKDKAPLTEAELEIVSANLAQREAQHKEEVAAFQKTYETFQHDTENRTRNETNLETMVVSLREDVKRELDSIRAMSAAIRAPDRTSSTRDENRERDNCLYGNEHRERDNYPRENERRERNMSETPRITFREVTESIPTFDGYNISLMQFARACKRAKEIIPPSSEYDLTRVLINKLRGRAYYAVEDEPCTSITQLLDLLYGAFGASRTIDQYRGELSACYLKTGEHMLDYVSRIKELRTLILDAERREHGRIDPLTTSDVDELTARSFCDGLPLQYRLQMRPEHYAHPFEAFSTAKTLAKREELDRQRYSRAPPAPRPNPPPRNHDYQQVNTRYRSPPRRYERDNPPLRAITDGQRGFPPPRDPRNSNLHRPPPARSATNNVWCRYCKTPGHEIHECRKRAYNNGNGNNNNDNARQGNYPGPSTRQDPPRGGPHPTQQIRSIEATQEESPESEPSA